MISVYIIDNNYIRYDECEYKIKIKNISFFLILSNSNNTVESTEIYNEQSREKK